MAEPLVTEYISRSLQFIDVLTAGQVPVTVAALDAFAMSPVPRPGKRGPAPLAISTRIFGPDTNIHEADPVSGYLLKMGWIRETGGYVTLTHAGRLLLKSARVEESADSDTAIQILDPSSPFVYADVAGYFRDDRNDLLIDRYVDLAALKWIHGHGGVKRIVTSERSAKSFALEISNPKDSLGIDIRIYDYEKFHDRALTRSNGSVLAMGQSVNGLGKQLSIMIQLSPEIADIYRERLEAIWQDSTPVEGTVGR